MTIRKSGERILEILITTMILLCLFPAMQVNAASISVEPSSLTLEAGKTATVYASVTGSDSYSYSWSSEGGVVSVTGNGAKATVRGLEAGTGKVKVSVSKNTLVSMMVRKPDGSYGYQYVTKTEDIGSRSINVTVTGSSGSGSGSGGGGTVVTHNWVAGNIISEPTCGAVGTRRDYCTKCNATKLVTLPATGAHVYNDGTVLSEPSCGSGGLRKYTCTVCGNYYTETIAATGEHTFGETVVTREPNCKYEGSGIQTCIVCGKEETVTIPTNNEHDYQFDTIVKEGNCTEKGIRRDYCQHCFKTRDSELALNPDYHAEIILDQEEYSANVGDTIQLEPTLSEDHCSSEFTYASSDESIASVSEEGLITVLSYGAAQITVQNAHGQKAFCTVHTPMPEQMTTTGGSSSLTNTLPFATQHGYATTQTIYTPAMLTHAGTISRIAYYVGNAVAFRTDEVRIYMEKTSRGSYNSGSDYVCSAPVLVYTGSPILGAKSGWETFVLDTPFEYDGSSNLAVTVVRSSAGLATSALYYYWRTQDQNMSLSRSSSSDKTYAQITSTQGFELQAHIPDTRFTLENDVAGYCTENGHDYSEPQVKEANCYFDGYTWRYCKRCGHVEKTDKEYSSYHDWDVFDKKEATCTEPGWETYVKCRNCSFSNYLEIPVIDHTVEIDEAVSPDCTHAGLTAGTHCKVCNTILTPQEEIPALGHTPVRSEAKDASCEEPGLTEGEYCSVCGEILNPPELIPAEHKMATLNAVEADCTHEGMTEGSYCTVCGMIIDEQEVTPALGHSLSKKEAREASCTEEGCGEYYECDRCHGLFADDDGSDEIAEKPVIDKLGHSLNKVEAKEASCTEEGCGEYYECGRCHRLFADNDGSDEIAEKPVIAKIAHSLDKVEAKEPTCTEGGNEEYFICSSCNKMFRDPSGETEITDYVHIDPAGHDLEKIDGSEATCKEEGVYEHWYCKACGQYFADDAGMSTISEKDTIIPKVEHQWDEGTETEASSCEEDRSVIYTCTKCGESFTESVPASGHSFSEWATTKAPTEISAGLQSRTCTVCKATETRAIAALAPTLPAVKIVKPAAGKKSATIKWKKVSSKNLKKVKKIEIQYSLDRNFRTGVKTKYATAKKTSLKIKGLKPKKTYYVRIRAYTNAGSAIHVSKWSSIKNAKIR